VVPLPGDFGYRSDSAVLHRSPVYL
jgi:hypothetical protein